MEGKSNNSMSPEPVAKQLRKKWKSNPEAPIPRSTYYRWQKQRRLRDEADSTTNIEPSESVSNIPAHDISSCCSLSSDDTESSDCDIEIEDDCFNDPANDAVSDITEFNDFSDSTNIATIDSDDEHYSISSSETESFGNMSSFVTKLYDGSDFSVTQAVVMITNLYVQNKLSKAALQQLLTMVHQLLPKDNKLPNTLHKLFKFIEDAASSYRIIRHYYCSECSYYYHTNADVEVCTFCSSTKGTSYFFEIDLVDLIKDMFERRNLASKLHVSEREENIISDITDGSEYMRVNSRPDKNEFDLTLMLNTDGISLIKSSKSHCWPLMFMIAELPEYLRESFIGIIGLWYDTNQKPLMNTFLQPFCEKLNQCFHEGIEWIHPSTQEVHISKIVAPLFIADAPARAEIQNISYFSGKYGCNLCEMKTKRCQKEKDDKKAVRRYIFREKQPKLRTHDRMEEQAQFALANNLSNKRGVKGRSIITTLPLLDRATCVLPEYMHSVLLGVGKQFMNLWLQKKGKWNVSKNIKKIDEMLLDIRPPAFFNRMPRSLTNLSNYKASEFYNLILFYSIPIFREHLADVYLQHWMLFVVAIFNLLKKPIRIYPELEQAEMLLQIFVRDIMTLYGNRQYTYNVHQLLHLTLCIKRWGPLWSTSAFPFENVNRILATCIHGSKHLGQEMVNNLKIMQGIQNLRVMSEENKDNFVRTDSQKYEMLDETDIKKISDGTLMASIQSLQVNTEHMRYFLRCRIGNDNYTSENYKITKSNSYSVEIDTYDKIINGAIQIFIHINNELSIILKHFDIDERRTLCHYETGTIVSHIVPITDKKDYICINVNNIRRMSHVISVANYICKRPNQLNKVM